MNAVTKPKHFAEQQAVPEQIGNLEVPAAIESISFDMPEPAITPLD
ncbi:hypothetical protein [Cupriavidus necator]